jgi:hypothetical protein
MKMLASLFLALSVFTSPVFPMPVVKTLHASVEKRRKQVSIPKSRFKTESAAVREAERKNPGFKATKVIEQKTAWLIRLEGE